MEITGLQCVSCYAPLDATNQHKSLIVCGYCGTENALGDDLRSIRAEYSHRFRVRLINAIEFSFGSLDEIKYLIIQLDGYLEGYRVDYDNLSGSTIRMKSMELVQWCYRRGLLQELVDVCLQLRPRMEI